MLIEDVNEDSSDKYEIDTEEKSWLITFAI
jgi:hypothetical protein